MKNKGYTLAICGIVVVITIFLYCVLVEDILEFPMALLTLSTLLVSELVAIAALLFLNSGLRRITLAVVFGAHALLTAIVGSLFVNVFLFFYLAYAVFYILSFALAAVVALFILHNSSEAVTKNNAFRAAKISTLTLRAPVNRMIHSPAGAPYADLLQKLDEDLRFMDDSQIDSMDSQIFAQISDLETNLATPGFQVEAAVTNIRNMIQHRNFMVKLSKSNR